jgi:glycosyltransferase involved in cell wall biosynthesis
VAVSAHVERLCEAAGIGPTCVVYDGVPVDQGVPVDEGVPPAAGRALPIDVATPSPAAVPPRVPGERVFLAAGALVPHKGHAFLVEAMRSVAGTLWLAGDGPLRAPLEALAAPLGERVRLLGAVRDLAPLFAAADVFVHPSIEEAAGSVLLEAMVAALPVVATTAGGQPELVGEAGLLVPPGDAQALAEAMSMPRARGEGVERGRSFSVERMVRETEAAYARALSSPAR